jgi:predicted enzyme related to lactoylglutathione lyase
MSEVKAYPHGTFSWVDLATTDAAAAQTFYRGLFGWEAVDMPLPGGGVYTMLLQAGKNVTALSQMSPEMQASGMPTIWNSYISVDDVEATAARVADLGGAVIAGPFDVMDAGRMATIQDPTGAVVNLWQTAGHRGADIFNVPNSLGWNELATRDGDAARSFYTALIGWEAATDENNYTVWLNQGRANGGMIIMDENWPDVPAHWMVYFSVADVQATVAQAKVLGGKVHMGPTPAGDAGTFALIEDPTGATFTAIQLNAPDTDLPGE